MTTPRMTTPGMRVLVTGAEGLVGSAVVAGLREHGHTVLALDGDARDPAAVAGAIQAGGIHDGIDAVAHLAAIADPLADPYQLFANNTQATFNVLWTAAEHGVRRFAIASSANASGLRLNPHRPRPDRYPIDEHSGGDVADPYSLAKRVDEQTLAAVCRRFGATGVALRLPLMISPSNLDNLRRWTAEHLEDGVGDGWAWLDVRDGAEAIRLALTANYTGAHVVQVAASETFVDTPTDELLARHAPGVPRPGYPGHAAPLDTSRATALLGFTPRYGVVSRIREA
jgi:nucleoside-diphosphate-sugar epimerase